MMPDNTAEIYVPGHMTHYTMTSQFILNSWIHYVFLPLASFPAELELRVNGAYLDKIF